MSLHALSLSHYGRGAIATVRDGDPAGRGGAYKPAGLWVSVDGEDDWPSWCAGESFQTGITFVHHRVRLATDANVLLLARPDDLLAFTARFGLVRRRDFYKEIQWPAVALHYDGLIIAPYQWSCRLNEETNWYYSWDCSSGVIWKARAVASVEVVGEVKFKGRDEAEAA